MSQSSKHPMLDPLADDWQQMLLKLLELPTPGTWLEATQIAIAAREMATQASEHKTMKRKAVELQVAAQYTADTIMKLLEGLHRMLPRP